MDSKARLYLERAKNELDLARAIFKISITPEIKLLLELKEDVTFFSDAISNAYYCIFYSAKAFLSSKEIVTEPPEEHQKTYVEFEKLTLSGEIDVKLLNIYKSLVVKADELLGIFKWEKSKRGKFTYRKLPQANMEPASESIANAEKFLKNINLMLRK
ncbi:MAG: HEPN domain-containing protein [Nanoarchaeota archaeon]|nr:HEPN domain-containing protein [Nanoarchaeota archaeon]